MSPFKPAESQQKREFATVTKSVGKARNVFDDEDLNDRMDFDKSIKVVGSSAGKRSRASPETVQKKNRTTVD